MYWNVRELSSSKLDWRNENLMTFLDQMFLVKDVNVTMILQLMKLFRRILELLKSLSSNFMQILLLDLYMYVHVVTKHGLGKVFPY